MSLSEHFGKWLDNFSPLEEGEEASARALHWRYANTLITTLLIVNVALVVFQAAVQTVLSYPSLLDMLNGALSALNAFTIGYYGLFIVTAASLVYLFVLDRRGRIHRARMLTRVIVVLLVAGFLVNIVVNGVCPVVFTYLFQFVCVIAYQLYNDPHLARPLHFTNPFSRDKKADPDPDRKAYIPLDFFNIFWIFIIGSFAGLCIEMVFCLFVNNVWECRAGLVFAPLSPIYGTGATLLTFALNRVWNKNAALIYVISGIVGAAVEFGVSWYMETAFGVLAWDYSDEFLNIQGRTDLAHALAWGALGLVWMRILLPTILRTARAVPLRWRALVTTVALVFFLVDGMTTLVALDCWSARQAGVPVQTNEQKFFAEHFDDKFMRERFSNMGMSAESAARAQANMSQAEGQVAGDFSGSGAKIEDGALVPADGASAGGGASGGEASGGGSASSAASGGETSGDGGAESGGTGAADTTTSGADAASGSASAGAGTGGAAS